MVESEPEKSAKGAITAEEFLEKVQAVARGLREGHELFTIAQLEQIAEACAESDETRKGRVVEEFADWFGVKLALWCIGDHSVTPGSLTNLMTSLLLGMDRPDGVFRDFLIMSGNESPPPHGESARLHRELKKDYENLMEACGAAGNLMDTCSPQEIKASTDRLHTMANQYKVALMRAAKLEKWRDDMLALALDALEQRVKDMLGYMETVKQGGRAKRASQQLQNLVNMADDLASGTQLSSEAGSHVLNLINLGVGDMRDSAIKTAAMNSARRLQRAMNENADKTKKRINFDECSGAAPSKWGQRGAPPVEQEKTTQLKWNVAAGSEAGGLPLG